MFLVKELTIKKYLEMIWTPQRKCNLKLAWKTIYCQEVYIIELYQISFHNPKSHWFLTILQIIRLINKSPQKQLKTHSDPSRKKTRYQSHWSWMLTLPNLKTSQTLKKTSMNHLLIPTIRRITNGFCSFCKIHLRNMKTASQTIQIKLLKITKQEDRAKWTRKSN